MTIIVLRCNKIGVLILYLLDIRDVMSENVIVALSICAIHLWPKKSRELRVLIDYRTSVETILYNS